MSGSLMYILYEYSNISGNYTWHLMSYDINTNVNSSDLNFSASSVSSGTVSLTSGSNVLYYMANKNVHEYNIANNTTSIIGTSAYNMGKSIYYNGYLYYRGIDSSLGTISIIKYNVNDNTTFVTNTNIPYTVYNQSIDNNGNFYYYGTVVYNPTVYSGHTYKITLP
jgi:hypothetical protein